MSRYPPQWLQSGSYAASLDRRLLGALWPTPACFGCAVTPAGTGMDLHVDAGQVAVPTANNTGTVLCSSDAIETIPTGPGGILPAPPAGTDRVDLIVCQPRSMDLDGVSTQEDFIFAVVTGAEGAPPGARPATPVGTVALAAVHVAGGSASLVAGDITDLRPGPLAVGTEADWSRPRGYVAGYRMQPAADISAAGLVTGPQLVVPVLANRRYRITLTGRGSTSAAGGASIRISGPGFPSGPWSNYQMVVERTNAATEALSGTGVTFYDATAAGSPSFALNFYGAGTVKCLGSSCSATAEDIGGF